MTPKLDFIHFYPAPGPSVIESTDLAGTNCQLVPQGPTDLLRYPCGVPSLPMASNELFSVALSD